jgi:glycosyltransferase involved in cell wall biosynthesis
MKLQLPIKILMTTDAVGGVWTYSTALASTLAASGAEIHLVTLGPPPRPDQRAMLRDRRIRLIETDLALEWQDAGGADLPRAQRLLERLQDEIRPDIVHLNGFREATFDWTAPVVVVAHSCVNSWALACNDTEWLSDPKWKTYTNGVAAGLSSASVWVSPSQAFHDTIRDLYHPASPGFVIWNGIAPTAVHENPKRRSILAAGRMWDPAKGLSALAGAAQQLDWPICIAGQAHDSGEASAVTLLGDLSHQALLLRMQHAAIFASPARYEPFGLSVLEAACAGCALVLSDIPTFQELWDAAALFVNPADAGELHRALSGLCTDHQERERLQHAARERSQRYSLARTAEAYGRLYQGLLAPHSRPATADAVEVHA